MRPHFSDEITEGTTVCFYHAAVGNDQSCDFGKK